METLDGPKAISWSSGSANARAPDSHIIPLFNELRRTSQKQKGHIDVSKGEIAAIALESFSAVGRLASSRYPGGCR